MPILLNITKKKSLIIICTILLAWLIFAQSCMKFRISDTAATKEFKEAGVVLKLQNISNNNSLVHYAQTGSDDLPTIVFVHGSPGSWDAFKAYLKDTQLLQHFRMVSIDRPGFGYSNFGNALNLKDQSKAITPLFTILQNGKPLYLVGHSLGGPLIVQLAADNPNVFSGLVILAGSIDANEETPEKWRAIVKNSPLKYLLPGAFKPSNDELWMLKKDLINLRPKFAQINCPVHIVHGNKDVLVPYANMNFGVQAFTHTSKLDTTTLIGANHFIPWSHYSEVKRILLGLGK
jgi:pimeloyl-ACP methyl ester carboxylesterase